MSKSDIGNYSYSDNGYNNPHAAVAIGGNAHIYDNNGNLISDGTWTHGWDYGNRLISSAHGSSAINYAYDHSGNRLIYSDGTATTTYVNKYFNISNAGTITKNLFLGDQLIATIETNGTSTSAYYVHTDHLGGTNVITDRDGAIVELLDYMPFGDVRIDERSGEFQEQKQFAGYEKDQETGLNYLGARYYPGTTTRFLNIDPVYNDIGNEAIIKSKTGLKIQQLLENPQALNSYSYSYNNPLIYRDNTGEFAFLAPIVAYAVAYAPVWVPAAITTVSAIGAGVSSWFMGESVGYMMEGNSQAANQSLGNAQAALGATAVGVGGLMAADTVIGQTANRATVQKATISNTAQKIGSGHAYDKHVVREGQFSGIATNKNEFSSHIENVMNNPSAMRQLEKGRAAYYQQRTNTIVINDPSRADKGTAFQPSTQVHGYKSNMDYFNKGLR